MVVNKLKIDQIKLIIQTNFRKLAMKMIDKHIVSPQANIGKKDLEAPMTLTYYHNWLNEQGNPDNPSSVDDMKNQQSQAGVLPIGEAHDTSIQHLNSGLQQYIEKLSTDLQSKIENKIWDNNNSYKFNALQAMDRTEHEDDLVKESSVAGLKRSLKELTDKSNVDWDRVVNTEISNGIGMGSVDRIVNDNKIKDLDEVYVYRISINDGKICKYCKEFYLNGNTPKIYKLSNLLSNGSNYGKKAASWKPTVLATHPNCRESQILELKPGWKVLPGGSVTFIGVDKWQEYIQSESE